MCAKKLWDKTKRAGDSRATVFSTKLSSNMMAFVLHLHHRLFQEEEEEMRRKEDPGQEQEWGERQNGKRGKGKSDPG